MNIIWSHFIVRQTTEDSFIALHVTKKWGGVAQKPESLGVLKVGGGFKPSSLIEVYAYVFYWGTDKRPRNKRPPDKRPQNATSRCY